MRSVALFCAPAPMPAPVATKTADFSAEDISKIAETSRTNAVRFERDYKGRTFDDVMVLDHIAETWNKGVYRISLKTNLALGFGGGVDCKLSDPRSLDVAANWNKGQRVEVSGVIEDTSVGDLALSSCRMRALLRTEATARPALVFL